jgi:polyferredoxin
MGRNNKGTSEIDINLGVISMKKLIFLTISLALVGIATGTSFVCAAGNSCPSKPVIIALESNTADASNPTGAASANNTDTKSTVSTVDHTSSSAADVTPPVMPKPTAANKTVIGTSLVMPTSAGNMNNSGKTLQVIHSNQKNLRRQPNFKVLLATLSLKDILLLNGSFWSAIPLSIGLWCLFSGAVILLYLLKLKSLRQPMLFLSVIFFGFYLGGIPDPINAIFAIPARNQIALSVILVLFPVILSLFWGRFYCGWLCPLGAVQEFLNPEHETRVLPKPLDGVLKYLKVVILVVLGFLSWHSVANGWQNYNLTKTLFTFSGPLMTILILAVILIISLLVSRPFCKYLCPLGAILAFTSKYSPFRMRADVKKCMVCGKCIKGDCPMDAISAFNPEIDLPSIDNSECIKCSQCQKNCRNSALRVTGFRIDRVYHTEKQSGTLGK